MAMNYVGGNQMEKKQLKVGDKVKVRDFS